MTDPTPSDAALTADDTDAAEVDETTEAAQAGDTEDGTAPPTAG